MDQQKSLLQRAVCLCRIAFELGLTALGSQSAQGLYLLKQFVAALLAQHIAQQRAQRTHIAPQRSLFQLRLMRFKLGQPLSPVRRLP